VLVALYLIMHATIWAQLRAPNRRPYSNPHGSEDSAGATISPSSLTTLTNHLRQAGRIPALIAVLESTCTAMTLQRAAEVVWADRQPKFF